MPSLFFLKAIWLLLLARTVRTNAEIPSPAIPSRVTEKLCTAPVGTSYNYAKAKEKFPHYAKAIETVESHGVATWYTDNVDLQANRKAIKSLLDACTTQDRAVIVVYGIPHKDCAGGFSNSGSNKNMQDYQRFLGELTSLVGDRKVLYVVEPDAVGLIPNNGCGKALGYAEYIKQAIKVLSSSNNQDHTQAQLFLDVGFWTIQWNSPQLVAIVNEIWPSNDPRVKGIVLNTSNYQSTSKMAQLCDKFLRESGRTSSNATSGSCVIDTSRNYLGAPTSNEWCNTKPAGIGKPATSDTGLDQVSFFIWIKPPGESDGECNGGNDQLKGGPRAGEFFQSHFQMLWNNGYFVQEQAHNKL